MVASAQKDTTLRLGLSPDTTLLKGNLKMQKKVQQAVNAFWIEGSSITIICKNSPDIIEKVIGAVRASAVEHVVIEKPAIEKPIQTIIEQPKAREKYDPAIDKFLNIEDESIFLDSKFMSLDEQDVHPRSYNYYCLIRNIFDFKTKLDSVRSLWLQQKEGQDEQAKIILDEMYAIGEKIIGGGFKSELNLLSDKQLDYYNNMTREFARMWKFYH